MKNYIFFFEKSGPTKNCNLANIYKGKYICLKFIENGFNTGELILNKTLIFRNILNFGDSML